MTKRKEKRKKARKRKKNRETKKKRKTTLIYIKTKIEGRKKGSME